MSLVANSPKPRSRFAPSPTGRMHPGNLRTALLVWLDARARGATLVLRMEDLDRRREVPGAAERILRDLEWLGLDWDEGPGAGGAFGPYKQSERFEFYEAEIEKLLGKGLLYPCFCSRKDLAHAALAPAPGEEGPPYPGTCAHLSPEEIRHRKDPFALRFRVPKGEVELVDRVYGKFRRDVAATTGDFIVRRKDRVAAYQLAVVLDDAAMAVTDVVRGADLLDSTPRQILLYRSLPKEPPRFAHVPLVLGPSGAKFSKRERAVHVGAFQDAGKSALDVVGLLAWTAGLLPKPRPVRAAELVSDFRLEAVGTRNFRLDPLKFL